VSGGAKGAILNLPFSEPMRAAGEDDAANLMIAMGVGLGTPLGAAGRVGQAAGRRASAADSDVGRMLAEVQQTGTQRPPKRANPDAEVMRTLTEAELAGGDVSAMVKNLSPDQLNEFAAVQGYFRDSVDFVPLGAEDFAVNVQGLSGLDGGPIFFDAPDGQRPRVFVNVEDAKSIKAGDLGKAFLKSDTMPERQKAAMINSVGTLYTPDQVAARERAIAKAEVEARYAKHGVKVGDNDPEVDLRIALNRAQWQREFGDAGAGVRQAIAAEDLANGIVDWNRMRRALPLGENPVTFLENVLGAQARGLQISGVRIDPETGRPLDTPDSLKRTNPAAADDPAVAQGLKNYTEGYNKMRRDPANETPVAEPVSPERAAAIELSMTDAPLRARQIMDLAGGPDGPDLAPTDPNFGWRQEGNRRVLAGMRLPDRIRLANHWRNELPKIDEIQRYMDSGEYVVMRWDAIGESADVTKREAPQYGAITREGRILRWNATTGRKREKYKGGGNLNVQIADYTTLRNNVLTVIEKKHPALDPARGGPGYSIEGIMADVDVYLANRRTGADLGTGLTPERLRVTEGLVEGRRGNIFTGVLDSDGIVREARIELVETIQPTGRRGHNMVGNNADGTFTQPPPKPMPDMGTDVAPAAPDAPAAAARDRIKRNLNSQSGALDVSILADIVDYGRSLYRAGMDAAVWTANMIKEFGERIRPLLKQAFDQVRNAYQASRFSDTTGAVNVTPMNKPKAAAAGAPFYMKSAQVLDSKIQGKAATADQVRAILKNPQNGIKAEELKWTGIEQAVERIAKENGGKVPKEALLRYLQEDGAVRLEEVRLGSDARSFDPPEFAQYQLPGGENYREVVLAMPPNPISPEAKQITDKYGIPYDKSSAYLLQGAGATLDEIRQYQRGIEAASFGPEYRSTHFPDTPNYVAHARLNERTDAAGKPGLFLEEIQSDRHQAGREKGYALTDAERAEVKALEDKARREGGVVRFSPEDRARWDELGARVEGGGVPDAPFRKDWPIQMFKRALADAVENGKEWIGWTEGITQVDRYTEALRQRVKSIEWTREDGLTIVDVQPQQGKRIYLPVKDGKIYRTADQQSLVGKDLSEVIGKEAAAKVNDAASGKLASENLTIGGEGMKGFYDQILPKEISKYVKQWGGQVEKSSIRTETAFDPSKTTAFRIVDRNGNDAGGNADGTMAQRQADQLSRGQPERAPFTVKSSVQQVAAPIWRVNITPQMREGIKKAGQALFVGGMAAVVAEQDQQ
jgi:hypothetical protein